MDQKLSILPVGITIAALVVEKIECITLPKNYYRPMTKTKCAECNAEMDLSIHAATSCSGCDGHFCCALFYECYVAYHRKNGLTNGHGSLTITNPQWVVNILRSNLPPEQQNMQETGEK